MIDELKSKPLLTGFRGSPERDIGALQDILLRISRLVDDIPQIAELDCNPVLVHSQGATIVDARIRLSQSARDRQDILLASQNQLASTS